MVPGRIVRVTDIQLSGLTQRLQPRAAFAVWIPLVEFRFFQNRTSHPLSFLTVASRFVKPIACLPM